MLSSSYNDTLVAFSIFVAILASYTALDMASRVSSASGRISVMWLAGGAFAMGLGIWSMHFIGMLAFSLPIAIGYDIGLTVTSVAISILSSLATLWLVCQESLPKLRLAIGAVLIGSGIAAMHYTGMEAMRMMPGIVYDAGLFALSIVIAILASGAALWMAFKLRRPLQKRIFTRLGASLIMGCAIVGMHYTGMAAAQFPEGSICGAIHNSLDTQWLALLVIIVTFAVLAIALTISMLDARLALHISDFGKSLAEANDELIQLALHDNLTKLPNRTLLHDRIEQAIHKAAREKGSFAILFMDLDGFKAINDIQGHHTGDLLLIEVAQRIRQTVRDQDTVARLGGDEFVLLTEVNAPEDAAAFAERLLSQLNMPYMVEKQELFVSASIGIALYPDNGDTQHSLMINADAAMYHAKEQGRNGYCFFETSMNADAHEHLRLLQDLRQALEKDQFILQYQPKFIAPKGPVTGAEALLRWQHPDYGLLSPDKFLALAEKTGLIIPIGYWVLNEACRQMREWRNQGRTNWNIAVNLSSVQFAHVNLIGIVSETLKRHELQPHHLTLEITESTAMKDMETSLATLDELALMGVNISIDDFGTGYSSLMYLKRLPATELKIDRGFINDFLKDSDDAAIVASIIALGQTLNLNIVAEGVETSEQQSFLTGLGCDTLQGFLLGRPMSADELFDVASSAEQDLKTK